MTAGVETMKAIVQDEYGEADDVLRLRRACLERRVRPTVPPSYTLPGSAFSAAAV